MTKFLEILRNNVISFYLEHPQHFHPALIGVLLLVSSVLSSLSEPGEGHVEDLKEDDGRDGGALVHGVVDVPQRRRQVEAVLSTSYTDFPSELRRRKKYFVTSPII